ncbi:MAG TPA: SRPBCC family protein [Acidimicrobiia bacterium]|nr:SRPBCC family protein [Acidimicrobiia bacterium]
MDVSRVIAAPASTVWTLLAQPHHWPEWGPSVRAVECDDDEIRTGTRGMVRTPVGLWLPFTVTAVHAGRSWQWRVAGLAVTGHRIEPVNDHLTRVVFEIPSWGKPYAIVCRTALRNLARIANDVAEG